MSRLEEIKNEIVQEYGYKSFEEFDDKSTFSYDHDTPEIIKNIALKYAHECSQASLEKASEELTNHLYELGQSFTEQQAIIYTENIVLL